MTRFRNYAPVVALLALALTACAPAAPTADDAMDECIALFADYRDDPAAVCMDVAIEMGTEKFTKGFTDPQVRQFLRQEMEQ